MSETQTPAKTTKPAPQVNSVTMTDGRVVDFVGKRKLLKTIDTSGGEASVRFDFVNGETRTFVVPQSLLIQFAAHGASQKIGDETAGEDDVDDAILAVDNIVERLSRGEWGRERAAGDGFSGASVVIKALCQVTGKSVADVKAFLEKKLAATPGLTRNKLYASFRNPTTEVGQRIAALEAEKNAKAAGVDSADLLAELSGS